MSYVHHICFRLLGGVLLCYIVKNLWISDLVMQSYLHVHVRGSTNRNEGCIVYRETVHTFSLFMSIEAFRSQTSHVIC